MSFDRPRKPPSIVELITNSQTVRSEREKERATRRAAPGWSGLALRFDPQITMFGDRVEVTVHPKSPAYREGMRTGDVIIGRIHAPGYGEVPLQNLDQLKLQADTQIEVRFYRPGTTGHLANETTIVFKLARWPRMPEWEKNSSQVACGKHVAWNERLQYLFAMVAYLRDKIPSSSTAAQATRYLLLLVGHMNEKRVDKGVWPKHKTSAAALNLARRTVLDLSLTLSVCPGTI